MPSLPIRIGLAVRRLDQELERRGRDYPHVLPVGHLATLKGWNPQLRWVGGVLVRYTAEQFERLDPLEQQLEVNRAHAEALLVLSRAGELGLSDEKEEWLFQRAVGILPSNEDQAYEEIFSCSFLEPFYMTSRAERYLEGIGYIQHSFGQGVALGYGALLAAGVRTLADLVRYGGRIQQLFDSFVNRPAAYGLLEKITGGISQLGQDERQRLVWSLLDFLLQGRGVSNDSRFFTLTQLVDNYLEPRKSRAGDELSLAILDSILAAKLHLPIRHFIWQKRVYLELSVTDKIIEYWNPLEGQVDRIPSGAKAVDIATVLTESYLRMACGYVRLRSFANGARLARWILELRRDSVEARVLLAQCLLGQEHPRQAKEECLRALELDSKYADAYLTLGNAMAMMQRWSEAVSSYRQAVVCRADYAEALNNLGLALTKCAEHEKALQAYLEAVRIRPDYAEAYYNMGNLYLEMSRYVDAIEAYRNAVKYDPGLSGAYYNMGQAFYLAGDLQRSLEAYQEAVRVNPKHAGAWHNMGIVYRDLGQKEKAVEAIEKAVQLNPTLFR